MKRLAILGAAVLALAALPMLAIGMGGGRIPPNAGGGAGAGGGGGRAGGGAQPSSTLTQQRASPHDAVSAVIGGRGANSFRVTIYYGRPYTNDPNTKQPRKIWGGLVPWGQVWRMGSDEATTLITQQAIQIGDTIIPAGAYTLDMVPNETDKSKLVVNKSIGQWGIPYNDALVKTELARIDIPTKETLDKAVDEFTIAITPDQATGGGIIRASWENTAYVIPFKKAPATAPAGG